MANQIQKKFIADDAIDGSKLLLEQNQTIRQKDGSGGEIDVLAQINESIDDAKQEAKDYADQKISEIPEVDLSEIEQAIEDVGNALENEAQVREDADEALDAKIEIEKALAAAVKEGINGTHQLSQVVRRTIGGWVGAKHRRRPMIVPLVIEV
jgi:mRNA degradation ribonuclease J1/J2